MDNINFEFLNNQKITLYNKSFKITYTLIYFILIIFLDTHFRYSSIYVPTKLLSITQTQNINYYNTTPMNKISNNYYLGAQIYINYHCRTIQLSVPYKYFTCTLFECKQQLFVVNNYIYIYNGSIRYECINTI